MTILIRRSNLIIPATQFRMIRWAWNRNADAVTIDLQDGVPDTALETARETLQSAVTQVGKGGAEVFVRVNAAYVYADSAAAMCRDLLRYRPARPGIQNSTSPMPTQSSLSWSVITASSLAIPKSSLPSKPPPAYLAHPRDYHRIPTHPPGLHRRSRTRRVPGHRAKCRPRPLRVRSRTPLHRGHRRRRAAHRRRRSHGSWHGKSVPR